MRGDTPSGQRGGLEGKQRVKLGQVVKGRPKLRSSETEAQDSEAWPGRAVRCMRKHTTANLVGHPENKEENTECPGR